MQDTFLTLNNVGTVHLLVKFRLTMIAFPPTPSLLGTFENKSSTRKSCGKPQEA